jgi:hypothetical protein
MSDLLSEPERDHGFDVARAVGVGLPLNQLLRLETIETCEGNVGPENFGPNVGPLTPKHHRKPRNTRDQRARRINKIENLAKSAKPPSPVQIRTAHPFFSFVRCAHLCLRRLRRLGLGRHTRGALRFATGRTSRSLSSRRCRFAARICAFAAFGGSAVLGTSEASSARRARELLEPIRTLSNPFELFRTLRTLSNPVHPSLVAQRPTSLQTQATF